MSALKQLHDGLWIAERPLAIGGLRLGTRTTIARLPDGLFVHSPGPVDGGVAEAVRKLGTVKHLVAPNAVHHLFLRRWKEVFPAAHVWAVKAVVPKSRVITDDLLTDTAPAAWSQTLEQHLVAGIPRLDEVVFFHRASRTLLLCDLAFNIRDTPHWFTRLFMKFNSISGGGGLGRFGPTRFLRSIVADKTALRASVERILRWDFDRITVTHGSIVEKGGREVFRDSFKWLR